MHNGNTDKVCKMSNQPSFSYLSNFSENVKCKSTEIGNKPAIEFIRVNCIGQIIKIHKKVILLSITLTIR